MRAAAATITPAKAGVIMDHKHRTLKQSLTREVRFYLYAVIIMALWLAALWCFE